MTWETIALRLQLAFIIILVALSAGLLFLISHESSQNYSELAHLQIPLYLAVLVGYLPVLAAIALAFPSLKSLDAGMPFAAVAQQALPRLKFLTAAFTGYMAIFLIGAWTALGDMHPSLLFPWIVVETAAVFLWTSLCLVDRHHSPQSETVSAKVDSLEYSQTGA